MAFSGTDFPVSQKEVQVDVNGKVTYWFSYRGDAINGFLCRAYTPGNVYIGDYDTKAHARTALTSAGA